jgi:hypothetical protein
MSDKKETANQRAFEQGQNDFRDGKSVNPYPIVAPYHDFWEQGFEAERDIHHK